MMMLALDRPEAAPQEVPQMPKISSRAQWAVVAEGIYFSPQDNPRSISFYDFATKHTRELFKVDRDLDQGMSLSPDGRYMPHSQIDESNADIMLVEHFRQAILMFRLAIRHSRIEPDGVFAEETNLPGKRLIQCTGERFSNREVTRRTIRRFIEQKAGRVYIVRLNERWLVDGAVGAKRRRIY